MARQRLQAGGACAHGSGGRSSGSRGKRRQRQAARAAARALAPRPRARGRGRARAPAPCVNAVGSCGYSAVISKPYSCGAPTGSASQNSLPFFAANDGLASRNSSHSAVVAPMATFLTCPAPRGAPGAAGKAQRRGARAAPRRCLGPSHEAVAPRPAACKWLAGRGGAAAGNRRRRWIVAALAGAAEKALPPARPPADLRCSRPPLRRPWPSCPLQRPTTWRQQWRRLGGSPKSPRYTRRGARNVAPRGCRAARRRALGGGAKGAGREEWAFGASGPDRRRRGAFGLLWELQRPSTRLRPALAAAAAPCRRRRCRHRRAAVAAAAAVPALRRLVSV
jgi:hypothetical protein